MRPPPKRTDVPKGRNEDGKAGREAFRNERTKWYLEATGKALEGSVAEQNEVYDIVARSFRGRTQ